MPRLNQDRFPKKGEKRSKSTSRSVSRSFTTARNETPNKYRSRSPRRSPVRRPASPPVPAVARRRAQEQHYEHFEHFQPFGRVRTPRPSETAESTPRRARPIIIQRTQKNVKAGLIFPVTKIKHMMKTGNYAPRIESTAPVFMAGVLEYLTIELLEISGNLCRRENNKRIQPEHILKAVRKDKDLKYNMWNTIISKAGHAAKSGGPNI